MMNAEALPLQVTLLSNFDPEIMTKRFNFKNPIKSCGVLRDLVPFIQFNLIHLMEECYFQ